MHEEGLRDLTIEINKLLSVMEARAVKLERRNRLN